MKAVRTETEALLADLARHGLDADQRAHAIRAINARLPDEAAAQIRLLLEAFGLERQTKLASR